MATKKIRNLDNTATIPASDDYDVIDGEVNGTRKILSSAREYVANKEQTALDTSFTKYPCNNVVKSALDLKATNTDLVSHTTNVSNPHNTTATQVGAPTISSGIIAPTSTPAKIGDMYVDTVLKQTYVANGTTSSANWIKQNGSYLLNAGVGIFNPLASTTYYIGQTNTTYFNTLATAYRITISVGGIITKVSGYNYFTSSGSSNPSLLYIRINGTTDYLVGSLDHSGSFKYFNNTSLNIPVATNDYIQFKVITSSEVVPVGLGISISALIDL